MEEKLFPIKHGLSSQIHSNDDDDDFLAPRTKKSLSQPSSRRKEIPNVASNSQLSQASPSSTSSWNPFSVDLAARLSLSRGPSTLFAPRNDQHAAKAHRSMNTSSTSASSASQPHETVRLPKGRGQATARLSESGPSSKNRLKPKPPANPSMTRPNSQLLIPKKSVLMEIRHLQNTTHLLLNKSCFQRLVREIMETSIARGRAYRIQTGALAAMQQAAEDHLVELFDLSNLATCHGRRVTLMPRDLRLVERMNKNFYIN